MIKKRKMDKVKAQTLAGVSSSTKSIFLFSFLFLFLISFSSAVPPQQTSDTTLDLEAVYPSDHKLGEDYYIHTHVFDTADEVLVTTGANCYYHFYNHQIDGGQHISIGNMTQFGAGYNATVNGSLINETGEYSTLIWCDMTDPANKIGYNKYTFKLTDSGSSQENEIIGENQKGIILAVLTLIAIILFITYLYNRGEYYLPMVSGILFLLSGIMAFSSLEPIVGTTMKDVIGVVLLGLGLLSLAEVIWRYFPDDNGY